MNNDTRIRIKEHLTSVMNKVIHKRVVEEPFDEEVLKREKPFGALLVPTEIWIGSKFERSFVTSLGQGIFEQIAVMIAEGTGAYADGQHKKVYKVKSAKIDRINEIVAETGKGQIRNIEEDMKELSSLKLNRFDEIKITFDVFIKRVDGRKEYYSFKTVKPNIGQCQKAKHSMLVVMQSVEGSKAYFGLPYNPAGEGNPYSDAKHALPYNVFNMDDDEHVLIGSDLWNKIGEDDNTYDELLDIFQEVGDIMKERIRNEYLKLTKNK